MRNWGKEWLISCPRSHIMRDRDSNWETHWSHAHQKSLMTCHRRKWRWTIKRNLFVLIHIKSKFFRNLNLKSLAYFLKVEPSLYSEHLHSSFMSTMFNSSLRTLTTDPTPHHQCHQPLSKILSGSFQLSETISLSAVSIYTSQVYPPKLLWGNHRQRLLLPKDKGNKMFSTQLKECHLSDQSDAPGWTEHFHLTTLPPTI